MQINIKDMHGVLKNAHIRSCLKYPVFSLQVFAQVVFRLHGSRFRIDFEELASSSRSDDFIAQLLKNNSINK